nr:hypothetical protein [uncultured Roseateles sp.]
MFDLAKKACPPEAWTSRTSEVISDENGLAPPAVQALVERHRQALRDDARGMIEVGHALCVNVTGWRGNDIVIHTPEVRALSMALDRAEAAPRDNRAYSWVLRVAGGEVAIGLFDAGAQLNTGNEESRHFCLPAGQGAAAG